MKRQSSTHICSVTDSEAIIVNLWAALEVVLPYPPTLDRVRGVPPLNIMNQIHRYCGTIRIICARAQSAAPAHMYIYQHHYWLVIENANLLPEPARSAAKLVQGDHPMDRMPDRIARGVSPAGEPFSVTAAVLMSRAFPLTIPAKYRLVNHASIPYQDHPAVRHFVVESCFGELRDYMIYARRTAMATGRKGAFVVTLGGDAATIAWVDTADIIARYAGYCVSRNKYFVSCVETFGDSYGSDDTCDVLYVWIEAGYCEASRDSRTRLTSYQFCYHLLESVELRRDKYKGKRPRGVVIRPDEEHDLRLSAPAELQMMNGCNELMARRCNRNDERSTNEMWTMMGPEQLRAVILEYCGRCDHCGAEVTYGSPDCTYRYCMGRLNTNEPYQYDNCRLLCKSCKAQAYWYLGDYKRLSCGPECGHAGAE